LLRNFLFQGKVLDVTKFVEVVWMRNFAEHESRQVPARPVRLNGASFHRRWICTLHHRLPGKAELTCAVFAVFAVFAVGAVCAVCAGLLQCLTRPEPGARYCLWCGLLFDVVVDWVVRQAIMQGMARVDVNLCRISDDLNDNWEVRVAQ
jgi:hypothetical protein